MGGYTIVPPSGSSGYSIVPPNQAAPPPTAQTASAAPSQDAGGWQDMVKNWVVDPAKTLGREVSSVGQTIAGAPGAISHAFTDPETIDEQAIAGGRKMPTDGLAGGLSRVGLGMERLTIGPLRTAGEWYSDAAKGNVPNAYEQALDVAPEAMGQGAGAVVGQKVSQSVAVDLPKTATEFFRRATSLNEVTKAGAGLYQGPIQRTIQTLRGAIQNEGAKTLNQAIEADKAAQTVQGRGTISAAPAIAEAAKAIEETGHIPTQQTRGILNRLNSQSVMTLEDAKNLRSDIGGAASRADRTGNAKLGKILWTAYDEVGNGMADRVQELQGTREPFDHYNNEFRAYYELNKGATGDVLDPLQDRHDAIPKLKNFSQADLTEVKEQMSQYGLNPKDLEKAQSDAKALVSAHDSISGKYNKSLYRLVLGGTGAAIALPLSVYAAARGAGLYGMAPMLLASYIGSKTAGLGDQMKAGEILRRLNVDPDSSKLFQVRNPVEGPKTFNYPDQDEAFSPQEKASKIKQARQ